jgi:hypothetical protein
MKRLVFFVLIISTVNVFAQKAGKRPNSKRYAETITAADLRKHLFVVAGAEMEGRETATPGQKKAAAYIETQLKNMGLEPGNNGSYQMFYPVYQDSLLTASLEVNGKRFELDRDFNPSFAANIDGVMKFSEVVFIPQDASLDSIKNLNMAGRLVMIAGSAPMGRGAQANPIFNALNGKGLAALLLIQNNYPRNPSIRKGNQTVTDFRRSITPQQYTISEAVAKTIMGDAYNKRRNQENTELVAPAGNITTFNCNIFLETRKATITLQSSNVLGFIPGTDLKDQYLFITAHYDHLGKRGDSIIYYGADDDGSGTVALMEMAEAFSKARSAGQGPRRTIVFMAVSGEEKGLWGSDYYSSHPIFSLEKTTADLNIDMIGRSDTTRPGDTTHYVYVVGDDKLSSDLRPISESANRNVNLQLDYKFNDPKDPNRIYYRSDHYNFAKKGVPIIFYYDGMLKGDYHRPTDTPDKINYNLFAKRTQLVFYTAWEMANRNDMLKRDIPLDTNVFNR